MVDKRTYADTLGVSEKALLFNIDAEQNVLGAPMVDPEAIKRLHWLEEGDFYRLGHQLLWRIYKDLDRRFGLIEQTLVRNELQKLDPDEQIVPRHYVGELVVYGMNATAAEHYGRILREYAVARRLMNTIGDLAAYVHTNVGQPTADLRRHCVDLIFEATKDSSQSRTRPLGQVIDDLVQETKARMEGNLEAHLLFSGFKELDRMVMGFEPGELIYIAARPRMGKSGLGQKILMNIARQLKRLQTGGTVDYVTLEMPEIQQARRMIAGEGNINSRAIRTGFRNHLSGQRDEIDQRAYERFLATAEQLKCELGEVMEVASEGMTVHELRDHLTEVVMTRKCRCVLVDQLDLLEEEKFSKGEQEHVSQVSRALKKIAVDMKIVVICLVQLNRNLEARAGVDGKRPQLPDLRMSGRLEMDADQVLMLHRPVVYDPTGPKDYPHYEDYTELWGAKLRDGDATDAMIPLAFAPYFASFTDWPGGWMRPPFENDKPGEQAWDKRLARLRAIEGEE